MQMRSCSSRSDLQERMAVRMSHDNDSERTQLQLGERGEGPERGRGPFPAGRQGDMESEITHLEGGVGRSQECLARFSYGGNFGNLKYRRIFPYTMSRTISKVEKWQPSTGESPRSETHFLTNLDKYRHLVGGCLYIKDNDGNLFNGSATLISPPIYGDHDHSYVTYWVTAAHNFESSEGSQLSVTINPGIFQYSDEVIDSDDTYELVPIRMGGTHYVGLFDQKDLFPSKSGKALNLSSSPDMAFGKVTTKIPLWPQTSLGKCLRWPTPDEHAIQERDLILKIGYPGTVREAAFKDLYGSNLSDQEVDLEWKDVWKNVLCEHTFSAAPAEVHAVGADSRVIKDEGSTWGGMSGCAVLDLISPWRLRGVHTGSALARKHNHFLSVHHPFFICGYADLVGPHLETIDSWPMEEMKRGVAAYLRGHKEFLKKVYLWTKVKMFVKDAEAKGGNDSGGQSKRQRSS